MFFAPRVSLELVRNGPDKLSEIKSLLLLAIRRYFLRLEGLMSHRRLKLVYVLHGLYGPLSKILQEEVPEAKHTYAHRTYHLLGKMYANIFSSRAAGGTETFEKRCVRVE